MNKPKKNSIIEHALQYIVETSRNLLDLSATIIIEPRKLMRGMSLYGNTSYYPISKTIFNLKKSSYFSVSNESIYLSSKGRVEVIKRIIKRRGVMNQLKCKWIAIIFDIPEKNRKERNFLRTELKWIGFKELQKSIWIFPFDIKEELLTLLQLWKSDFSGDIRILMINEIIKDGDLAKILKQP